MTIDIKPEHNQYTEVRIHLILPAVTAKEVAELLIGERFRPFLYGKVEGSGVLTYLEALQRANHYKGKP